MADADATSAIDVVYDEMVDIRRTVHRQPELAFAEHATTGLIRERMAAWDIGELDRVVETGGIFAFDGGRPGGRPVVLRADIDALPIQEDPAEPFHSDVDGTMHACGHDVHVASLLGVAHALSAHRAELRGRFIFVFQPGEEALCGAKHMVDSGALEVMSDARLVGFHVTSQIPIGLVALREGIAMSEAHSLRFTLTGPGGHAAIPTAKGDVIKATADLIGRLGLLVHDLTYEGTSCVCSAGTISAGTAANVVPTTASVTGTLRTFTDDQRREALLRLEAVCDVIADIHGVRVGLDLPEHTGAVINDGPVTNLVEAVSQDLLGRDHVLRAPPLSPSDDVSEFLRHLPGCYFFVGGANADGTSGMHHSPTFSVEDESLRVGATVVLRSAIALAGVMSTTSDLFSIASKTALVTGGTRGIGKMIAEGFVDAGAIVYISSRKADACAGVAAELSAKGTCIGLPADLSTEPGCRGLADEMATRVDHLDILVNNAGATWGAPLAEYDETAFEKVLALNVKGVFHLTKFVVPLLQAAGTVDEPARVINIGSIDGLSVPLLETYAYSASKAAVHHLTRHLAKRLAPTITVNAIAPGPFESKMMAATLSAFGEQIAANAPLKRIGRPDDMAGAAIYLSSRAGAYLTGAVIPVDGGIATTAS